MFKLGFQSCHLSSKHGVFLCSATLQECQTRQMPGVYNCFPFGELEETTMTSSNYVDEDYPARLEIKQSLPGWGDNCGSDSSTLETDVCVWRYALIVVHATQEEEVPCPTWSCCPQYWKAAAAHQKTLVKECWSHTSNSIWPSFYSARRHGRCPRLSLANSLCCHVFTAGVTWLVGTSESEQYC